MSNFLFQKHKPLNDIKIYEKLLFLLFKIVIMFFVINALILYILKIYYLSISIALIIFIGSSTYWLLFYFIRYVKYNFNSVVLKDDSTFSVQGKIWFNNYQFDVNLNKCKLYYTEIDQFGNGTLLFINIKFNERFTLNNKKFSQITICNSSFTKREISEICRVLNLNQYKFVRSKVYFYFIPFGNVDHSIPDEEIYYFYDT